MVLWAVWFSFFSNFPTSLGTSQFFLLVWLMAVPVLVLGGAPMSRITILLILSPTWSACWLVNRQFRWCHGKPQGAPCLFILGLCVGRYSGFTGEIRPRNSTSFSNYGVVRKINETTLLIWYAFISSYSSCVTEDTCFSELPIQDWTQPYKTFLEKMIGS